MPDVPRSRRTEDRRHRSRKPPAHDGADRQPLELVATCAPGLEELLLQELRDLHVEAPSAQRGAVRFRGTWETVCRANWRLRTANRVLVRLGVWAARDGDQLAEGAQRIVRDRERRWDGLSANALFDPRRTIAVRATSGRSQIRDTRWIALRVKDGLVDAQRGIYSRRSSIDRRDPDTPLRLWLSEDRASLLLDTTGASLDRRGYRRSLSAAPLRETLAAACILKSGWNGQGPVVDPMCGTGTLLAEAAFFSLGRAAGAQRDGWAFERLPGWNPGLFAAVRLEELPAPDPDVRLFGSDISRDAIHAARSNLERAKLLDRTTLLQKGAFEFEPPEGRPGLLLVNPPYGERSAPNPEQWKRIGDLFKQKYKGWKAVVLAGDADRGKHIGLKPSFRLPVRNGPLDVRMLGFDIY